MKWRIAAELRWWHFLVLAALLLLSAGVVRSQQMQKPGPMIRKIGQATLYRTRTCIVTRITVLEPSPIRPAVTEFYVIEGGSLNGRVEFPKCRVELIP